jgi:hypothetical protein
VTFLTEYDSTTALYVFVFVLLVEQDIASIHDAVFFFLRVCVFCVSTEVFRGQHGAHFYSDTRPQIIQSFWLYRKQILSGFATGHPEQSGVPQLVLY